MRLAIQGAQDRLKRDHQTARFLAWHAVAPHAGKKFPDLKTFMGLGEERKPGRTAERLDLDTAMRRWAAAQNAVEAAKAAQARKRQSRKTPPKPEDGEPHGV